MPADPVTKVRETVFYRCFRLHDNESNKIHFISYLFKYFCVCIMHRRNSYG